MCYCEAQRNLTQVRLATAARMVSSLIEEGGGRIAYDSDGGTQTVWLGLSRGQSSEQRYILVNRATLSGYPHITEAEFRK